MVKDKPVIEKELFSRMDKPFCKNANPMIAIYHHDFGIAVGIDGVIGEPNFVSFPGSIDNEICKWK